MKKAAAIASLVLGVSLLVGAVVTHATLQAPSSASTNEQLLERIEAEVAFAKGLAGRTTSSGP